jgi:NADH dehydrogenase
MSAPEKKTILIAGGGFAGVYAFLKLHAAYHKSEAVAVEMVSRENYFLFTPLLHEVATGGVSRDNILYNLRVILGCCLAQFHRAEVELVDLPARTIHTSKGPLRYDVLIYALGADAVLPRAVAARDARVLPLKRLEDAHHLKNGVLEIFERSETPEFAVIGGGPTGVEIAAELNEFLKDICVLFPNERRRVRLSLVHAGERLLPAFHSELGERAKAHLEKKGVGVFLNEKIVRITPREVVTERGVSIPAVLTVWTTGVLAHKVPFLPEVPTDG